MTTALGGRIREIRIVDLQAGTFFARVVIDHAGGQRRFRPDDGQIDGPFLGKGQQSGQIAVADGDVLTLGCRGCAPVARRDENPRHLARLAQLPGQRVFPPAGADEEYSGG